MTGAPRAGLDAAGRPGAPPVVLIHGTRLSRAQWRPQLELLGGDYRLLAPDLPGHGARLQQPFRFDEAVEDLRALIAEETGGRALVVGLSLGGYLAMTLARRHPERVAGAVLAGCTAELAGLAAVPYRVLAYALSGLLDQRRFQTVNAKLLRRLYPPAIAEPLVEAGFSLRSVPEVVTELGGRRFLPVVAGIARPTRYVNGARDVLFRRQEKRFVAATRGADLVVLRRALHLSNLDRPRAFAEALDGFARAIGWSSAAPG